MFQDVRGMFLVLKAKEVNRPNARQQVLLQHMFQNREAYVYGCNSLLLLEIARSLDDAYSCFVL